MKAAQVGLRGHGNYTRIHGNRGLMENCRCGDQQSMRLRVEPFDAADGELVDKVYMPDFPSYGKDAAEAGHGGGDYFTSYHFAEAIRENRQPYLDVYRGIDMSIVGILAWKSALSDSAPLEVPDFRDEAQRKLHEDDHWTPDPARSGPRQPPSSLRGDIEPTEEARERATRVWRENGYTGE